jgi:hypothetical protein
VCDREKVKKDGRKEGNERNKGERVICREKGEIERAWLILFPFNLMGKLPLAPMNYHALAICPHELPNVTPNPIKLPNPN